jgi:hypothetical protein
MFMTLRFAQNLTHTLSRMDENAVPRIMWYHSGHMMSVTAMQLIVLRLHVKTTDLAAWDAAGIIKE